MADLSQDWPTAENYYSRALSFKPDDADLINNLGYSYLLQNRLAEATQTLNRALQSDPQHASANANLAIVHVRQGNNEEALRRLTSVYDYDQAYSLLASLINEQQSMKSMNQVPPAAPATSSAIVAARPAGSAEPRLPPQAGSQSSATGGPAMAAPPITAALPPQGQNAAPQPFVAPPVNSAHVTYPSAPSMASPLVAARPIGGTFAFPTGSTDAQPAPQQTAVPRTSTVTLPPYHPASTTNSAPNAQISSRPEIRFPAWPANQPAAPVIPPAPQPRSMPVITPGFSMPSPPTSSPGLVIQPSATTSGEVWPTTSSPVSADRSGTEQWPDPANVVPSSAPGYPSLSQYADQLTQPNLTQPAPAYSQFPDSSINGTPATWPAHMPPAGPAPRQTAAQPAMSAAAPWPAPTSQSPAGYATDRSPTAAIPNAISRYEAAQQQQHGAYNRALEQMGRPLGVGSEEAAVPATNQGGTNAADGRPVHVYPPGM